MFLGIKNKLFGRNKSTKSTAKSRLHFVLVQDRTGLTNDEMASFKKALVDVIEKYFVIDKQGFDIAYQRESQTTTLLINSPVLVRRQDDPDKIAGARRKRRRQTPSVEPQPAV